MRLITTEEDDIPLPKAVEKTREKQPQTSGAKEKGDGKTASNIHKGIVIVKQCYRILSEKWRWQYTFMYANENMEKEKLVYQF